MFEVDWSGLNSAKGRVMRSGINGVGFSKKLHGAGNLSESKGLLGELW